MEVCPFCLVKMTTPQVYIGEVEKYYPFQMSLRIYPYDSPFMFIEFLVCKMKENFKNNK